MFSHNQITGGANYESSSVDSIYSGQWRETDQNQYEVQNDNHRLNNFQISQGSQGFDNGCLCLHSTPYPVGSDTTISTYEDQVLNESSSPVEIPSTITPVWKQENRQYFHSSGPVHNLSQLSPLPYQPVVIPHHHHMSKRHQYNSIMGRNHRAQISLVPTSGGKFKAIVKRKRKRTVFTTEQTDALEKYFTKKAYITREDRQLLVNQLKLNDKAVKVWFQNRRLKGKRAEDQLTPPDKLMQESRLISLTPPESYLDYIESQINEKTDEFGLVTLDDTVMGNLVNVIDTIINNNNNLDIPSDETISETGSSPIYEPISPAESTDEENNLPQWEPFEPKDSLQRLFDLQTVLHM